MNIETLPEPVLIDFDQQHWHHPDIEDLLTWEVNGHNQGKWSYDYLYRIYLETPQKDTAYIVVHWPGMEWRDFQQQDFDDIMPVILFDDVWMPGGEQFCFTDFGRALSEKFSDSATTFMSPDVGIEADESGYHWSS